MKNIKHLRWSTNYKKDKHKELHTQTHHSKNNERQRENLENKGEKTTYKGIPLRLTADLSTEEMEAKRQWDNIF